MIHARKKRIVNGYRALQPSHVPTCQTLTQSSIKLHAIKSNLHLIFCKKNGEMKQKRKK